jgi:hypothetical protein
MSVTGGWMLWLFVDVHVVLESERGNIAWYPYRCVPVYRCTCTSYLCAHLYTCNLLSTCMYVHTGTVHVVQERMDILPYMCVPYTGVRWGGGVQVARIKKNGTRVLYIHVYPFLNTLFYFIFQQAHNIGQHAKAHSR